MNALRITKGAIIWIIVSSGNYLFYLKAAEAFLPIIPFASRGTALTSVASTPPVSSAAFFVPSFRLAAVVVGRSRDQQQYLDEGNNTTLDNNSSFRSHDGLRRRYFYGTAMGLVSGMLLTNKNQAAWSFDKNDDDPPAPSGIAVTMCEKSASSGVPPNCVSTASVRQVDLYAAPWTWYDDAVSAEAIIARLKGAIAVDPSLTLIAQSSDGLIVSAQRNAFCTDQIIFRINANDRAVTFVSRQVQGPDGVSDFGANRKRLEQIRRATGVLQVMGLELDSADSMGHREGVKDQLKAFWGLQSGGGYESVLLDKDDDY